MTNKNIALGDGFWNANFRKSSPGDVRVGLTWENLPQNGERRSNYLGFKTGQKINGKVDTGSFCRGVGPR